jgi:hypothetical protein
MDLITDSDMNLQKVGLNELYLDNRNIIERSANGHLNFSTTQSS